MMNTPTPSPDDAPSSTLREPVALPPVSPKTRKALETTGKLPVVDTSYQMSDLLALAIQSGASDLHLRVNEPPLYRVNGRLIRAEGPPVHSKDAFNLIRAFTGEDVIRIVREVGRADFGVAFNQHRFRVNVFRVGGEWGAVLRRIPENVPTLEEILAPQIFYTLARPPRGLVLLTGPTGSGKTTTLAAMINLINSERSDVHILTLEDPIEFRHPRKQAVVTQRELGTDFPYLRRRDEGGVAGGSGCHHGGRNARSRNDGGSVAGGRDRTSGPFHGSHGWGEGHRGSNCQRGAGAPSGPRPLPAWLNPARRDLSQVLLPRASGGGRVAAFEIMVGTSAIGNLIRENKAHQIPSFLQTQAKEGMCTLDQSLARRYAEGLITREVAMERAQNVHELQSLIQEADIKRGRG